MSSHWTDFDPSYQSEGRIVVNSEPGYWRNRCPTSMVEMNLSGAFCFRPVACDTAMPKIFFCYRRNVPCYAAGRIYDRLVDHLGTEHITPAGKLRNWFLCKTA